MTKSRIMTKLKKTKSRIDCVYKLSFLKWNCDFYNNFTLYFIPIFFFRQEVLAIFRDRDRDLDGKMSFEEFCGHKSRYELAFEAIDKNGDSFVSRSEFKRICPNLTAEQTQAAFAKFDQVSSFLSHGISLLS